MVNVEDFKATLKKRLEEPSTSSSVVELRYTLEMNVDELMKSISGLKREDVGLKFLDTIGYIVRINENIMKMKDEKFTCTEYKIPKNAPRTYFYICPNAIIQVTLGEVTEHIVTGDLTITAPFETAKVLLENILTTISNYPYTIEII
jgi:hypothetical protein